MLSSKMVAGEQHCSMEREARAGGHIRPLHQGDQAGLRLFAKSYRLKPYYHYAGISRRRLAEFFHRDLQRTLDRGLAYGCIINDRIKGVLTFNYLPWDSRIFGIPMSKVDLYVDGADHGEAFSIARQLLAVVDDPYDERDIRHLVCKVNTQDIATVHAVEENGFRLMDTITVYSIQPDQVDTRSAEGSTDVRLREMRDEDLPRLSALSREVFSNPEDIKTRFNSDPHLKAKCGDLYAEWLRNSYLAEQADIVFVAEVDSRSIGFITCKLMSGGPEDGLGTTIGSIPLNAVDPEFRRLGAYRRLVVGAVDWFRQQGAKYVEIKTQVHTLGVHRTWQQLNGRLVDSYYTLHKWRELDL